jgi:hypothetical protein
MLKQVQHDEPDGHSTTVLQRPVHALFGRMRKSSSAGAGLTATMTRNLAREKMRDIVNFMNFTSKPIL